MRFHFSFKKKLLGAFLFCTLVPLILCSIFMVKISQIQLNKQEKIYIDREVDSLIHSLDIISEGLSGLATQLCFNPYIEQALMTSQADETEVNNLLYLGTSNIRNFASLELYDLQGKLKYSTSDNFETMSLPTWWGILHTAQLKDGTPVFQTGLYKSENEIPLFQGAVLLKNTHKIPIGYLVLTMHQKDFASLFDGKLNSQDNLLVVNQFFHPAYSTSNFLITEVTPALREYLTDENRDSFISKDFLFKIKYHKNTGLYIILIRQKVLTRNSSKIIYIVSIICAILGIIISVFISIPLRNQIFAPIQRLQNAFKVLGTGNLNIQLPTTKTIKEETKNLLKNDEMNQLAIDFNKMVNALKENQIELLQNQKDLDKAQLNLLQTQLNPHFLCNTLDTIKWISKINKVPKIAEMSANLADILRFCLIPEQFVPLYKEIEILNLYIEIQKIRMSDSFTFYVEIPEELELSIVPKMLLQPIVENSIIHGVDGSLDSTENSFIKVKATSKDKNLVIEVIDNGIGIPDELTGIKYTKLHPSNGHHLGLNNINTIISKHYGHEYGLFLEKGPENKGTKVTVILPITPQEITPGDTKSQDNTLQNKNKEGECL